MHTSEYRNPQMLPSGAVLVVGTGQSGCQIAEDLHESGRQVYLLYHLNISGQEKAPIWLRAF